MQILGLESLLGSADLWPVLLGLTVVPTVLQMSFLPFCPESPRFLYIVRCQEHQAKRGGIKSHGGVHRVRRKSLLTLSVLLTCDRPTEADWTAGGGGHAGRDEGGEEEDGHGEEGLHPGALSLSYVPPAHHHIHSAAALAATVRDQRREFRILHNSTEKPVPVKMFMTESGLAQSPPSQQIFYYSTSIFMKAGVHSPVYATIGAGVVNCAFTVVSVSNQKTACPAVEVELFTLYSTGFLKQVEQRVSQRCYHTANKILATAFIFQLIRFGLLVYLSC